MNRSLPTRQLREHPDLDQLKRQARELLDAFRAGEHTAVAEVQAHYRDADAARFALHDAQLVLARAYGFESWPKLKAYVDGVTMRRLDDAIRAGDLPRVRAMLQLRPELATFEVDNHDPLHYAVLNRSAEMVRLLLDHGAKARLGFYPHGEATSPLALAAARGYTEIVALIEEAERRARAGAPAGDALFSAFRARDTGRIIAILEADPGLIHTATPEGWTPLHGAAWTWDERLTAWLLAHGADPHRPGPQGVTPMDATITRPIRGAAADASRLRAVVDLLQKAGAPMTARVAAALGDAAWIRARHAEGVLPGPLNGTGGLLRIAVTHDQPEILALLLDLGFDPDERVRVQDIDEVEYSWGFPLWECAATGKHAMAEMLLERGADPNAAVYASGSPVSQAYGQQDGKMIALLERYGGFGDAGMAALHRRTQLAMRLLAEADDQRKVAEDLVWSAACGGDPEILEAALNHVRIPRDDPRWFSLLEQPLRLWNHGTGHWCHPEWDRSTYLTCFRLLLPHADPNVRGRPQDKGQFGLTILHGLAGSRHHMTPEERVAFATALLDAGARLDLRDNLLRSTPLGWACRWGRPELVKLYLARGADPAERDAEPWATPRAWAERMGHTDVIAALEAAQGSPGSAG